jgi:hypothetical protein
MDEFAQALREELIGATELPRKTLEAELAAIAERREQARRTNKAAIALFHDMRRAGAHIGRVQPRDARGRFSSAVERFWVPDGE